MADHEVFGGGHSDRLLGMLIERTEALREETAEQRRVTNDLREVHARAITTLEVLNRRCADLEEYGKRISGLPERVRILEDWRETRKRTTALHSSTYGGIVGSAVVIVWELLKSAFGHK